MLIDSKNFSDVSMNEVMTPAMRAIWDHMSIGVAIVDGKGICVYMNEIQARVDGFTTSGVVGKHITELYVPNGMARIPTMECLYRGEPLLRKAYWYKTINNSLFSSVTDFYPLFDHGMKDGVLAFTIWVDSALLTGEAKQNTRAPASASDSTRYTFESIIGHDPALRGAVSDARVAAKSPVPVMIWGENGTGKELFAQAIHSASPRKNHPFIAVNCAAIPENLLEGILFGTSKGAYTDAADKPGLFEKADGGTLLLDELNSMPLGLQAKLLRVLQEKRIRRLGSNSEKDVDVRVISILNEPPLTAVSRGILRNDLYYRLAVVGIAVPPLRERLEDIPLLIASFLQRAEDAPAGVRVSDSVMKLFWGYSWPGNIRELLHVIEGSLALLGSRNVITEDSLPRQFRESCLSRRAAEAAPAAVREEDAPLLDDYRNVRRNSVVPLKEKINAFESRCIRNVLRVTGGNVSKAAKIMELTGPGLRYKMKQLGITEEDY